MWPAKNSIDLLILSILNNQPDGLTGYSIAKQIEQVFGPLSKISPGTIYPRLKKLEDTGLIKNSGENQYTITTDGQRTLEHSIPEAIESSLHYWSKLFKSLFPFLSPTQLYTYVGKVNQNSFVGDVFAQGHCCSVQDINSTNELQQMKDQLKNLRDKVESRCQREIQNIDAQLSRVEEKLKRLSAERKEPKIIWVDEDL